MIEAREAERILSLARTHTPAARGELLLTLTGEYEAAHPPGAAESAEVDGLFSEVLVQLTRAVERDIRRRLALKLADAAWAPPALIHLLALDEIEIAAPVIASSPLLSDPDLVRILVTATLAHQVAVAGRDDISPEVVGAAIDIGAAPVLTALAGNTTARIDGPAMDRLVDAAEQIPDLRQPLADHPALQPAQAERLYRWVGEALASALRERFRLTGDMVGPLVEAAAGEAYAAAADAVPESGPAPTDAERDEAEARLIEKLHAAGQLRAGYLMRALKEGKLSLFEAALARIGGFSLSQVRQATNGKTPLMLALACAAVGLDRSVFATILNRVRELNHGRPGGDLGQGLRAAEAFSGHTPAQLAAAFRRTAAI